MKSFKYLFEGREVEVQAQKIGTTLWVHAEGQTFAFNQDDKKLKRGRDKQNSATGDRIEAPMPGKITKILKSAGDVVKKGDSLIALEAMKMEYTLKSEIDGTIKNILCETNTQVSLGQCLIELSPVESK